MIIAAIYFAGLAAALLWGEWQVRHRLASRGEQIVFSLAWPFMAAGTVCIISFGLLSDVAEGVDRRFT